MLAIFALLASVAAAAPTTSNNSAWLMNPEYQARAIASQPHKLPRYTVNLDLDPSDRWTHVAKDFVAEVPALKKYLASYVPAWALPILEAIGRDIEPYFGEEFGGEMKGLADALGLDAGEVVVVNLIYQIESVGLNCSNWNNTGPTRKDDPGCIAVDPDQRWCYCHNVSEFIEPASQQIPAAKTFSPESGPGLCTSLAARDSNGNIFHGRNLDWNLDSSLLKLAVDVEFQRSNKTLFTGATLVGFVGVFNGMSEAFSGSIDARDKGGMLWQNILDSLLHKASTPSQHLRVVLETARSFEEGQAALAAGDLINPVYYIVAGQTGDQGAIISRAREPKNNGPIKTLNATEWFVAETNYDWWNPVPSADDRRTPVLANMHSLTSQNVNATSLFDVMTRWPTFNHHTDYTGIFSASTGVYESTIWY